MTVYLWDLSNHDWGRHPVDLADARKAGISGVTHKATEDLGYRDPYLPAFAKQLRPLDFAAAGTYHVLHSGQIREQVDFWWEYVNATMPWWREHPCWLWQVDAERWADGYPSPAEVDEFADRIQAKVGCAVGQVPVYGPKWLYGDRLRVTDKPLWQSAYGANPAGRFKRAYPGDSADGWSPYSGHTPLILQYGSRTKIGKQPTCDANAVRVNSEAALQALFLGSPVPVDLLEEIMALKGAPATYKEFLADLAHEVWAYDQAGAKGKRQAWSYLQIAESEAHAAAARAAAVASVVNDLAPRIAQLQAAVAKLQPAAQVAVDVAAIASAAADAVWAKVKSMKLGVL